MVLAFEICGVLEERLCIDSQLEGAEGLCCSVADCYIEKLSAMEKQQHDDFSPHVRLEQNSIASGGVITKSTVLWVTHMGHSVRRT